MSIEAVKDFYEKILLYNDKHSAASFPYALSRGGTALCPERNAALAQYPDPDTASLHDPYRNPDSDRPHKPAPAPSGIFFKKSIRHLPCRCLRSSLRASLRLSYGSKSHFRSLYRPEDQPPGSAVSPHLYQPCQSCIHQFLSDTYLYEGTVPRFQNLWNPAGFRMAHDDCYASGVFQGKYSVGNIRHKKRDILLRLSRSRTGCLYYERF